MEEKEISNNTESKYLVMKQPQNKLTDKIIFLILIIIILALILGIVIVSATMINKKEDEPTKENAVTTSNSTNNTTENATSNQTIKQKDIEITYTTKVVKEIADGNAKYICREQVPEITGIDETAAKKIEENIKELNEKTWEEIETQNSEKSIKEILAGAKDYYESYEIGFTQSYKVVYLNNNVITFRSNFDGGIGGVSWATQSGISFNIKTGELINIEDIVTSKNNYISVCKEYVFEELKEDSRYAEVVTMHGKDYEETINSAIEQLGGYFTDDGIVCVEIPKYVIASGASGEFRFTIPYEQVSQYIKGEYDFSDINNKANLVKQKYIDDTKTAGTVMKKNK